MTESTRAQSFSYVTIRLMIIILVVVGLALGSFVNALVWRLHEQEQQISKKPSAKQKKYAEDLSIMKGRSMCPHCHHQLAPKDLVPVFSWLLLGGKCRYCQEPIGWQYPLVELLTLALFIFSYIYWPSAFHGAGLLEFICWLVFITGFMALSIYDLKWFLLPNRLVYPLLGLAIGQALVVILFFGGGWALLASSIWGGLIGGGIFYVLYQVSDGKWIGGGDVKLGALLGIIVVGPLEACLLLFTASILGLLTTLPLIALGRAKRDSIIPFGPFLLLAVIIVRIFGASIILWLRQHSFLPMT